MQHLVGLEADPKIVEKPYADDDDYTYSRIRSFKFNAIVLQRSTIIIIRGHTECSDLCVNCLKKSPSVDMHALLQNMFTPPTRGVI